MELSNDFQVYLRCAKRLILVLPNPLDRALASAWLKRLLQDTSIPDNMKNNYLKVLIVFLEMKKLVEPFSQHPSLFKTLSNLPVNNKDFKRHKTEKKKVQYGNDFSADLCSYVAYQTVQNFGAHCYYAVSKEPLTTWHRFDKDILPEGVTPGRVKMGLVDEVFDDIAIKEEKLKKKQELVSNIERKIDTEIKKVPFCFSLIGQKVPEEDRLPPSWGSNLVQSAYFHDHDVYFDPTLFDDEDYFDPVD